MDWALAGSALLLAAFGLLSIYSSSLSKGNFLNLEKQIFFLAIGFSLMILFSFLDWKIFRDNPYLILVLYLVAILFLAGLFFFGPEIRGVSNWYRIGPFSFDPLEFAKIIILILLARYFSKRHVEMYKMKHIFLSGLYVALPALLVFLFNAGGLVS